MPQAQNVATAGAAASAGANAGYDSLAKAMQYPIRYNVNQPGHTRSMLRLAERTPVPDRGAASGWPQCLNAALNIHPITNGTDLNLETAVDRSLALVRPHAD